nr:RNA-directed DNA polymerase, eukaryota [Tanacetum cinerariifolium]
MAGSIGCSIMKVPFKYLGVMVGGNMSKINAWDETVAKVKSRLSKWKLNTLSIGGRFTLLKSVLGSTPIYSMSLYKVPKSVLCELESIVAIFSIVPKPRFPFHFSNWMAIIQEVYGLKNQGVDFLSHCKLRVGSGMRTLFWKDIWLGDTPFCMLFPRLYALDNSKDCTVASKLQGDLAHSFRRPVREGVEAHQLDNIMEMVQPKVLSDIDDRWIWDLNGEEVFRVKDARDLLDEALLPKDNVATRWIKTVPIKVNIFAWKMSLDRILTRSNLVDAELWCLLRFAQFAILRLKTLRICSFAVMWPFRFLASFVVGGTCIGLLVVLIRSGWSGLNLSGWAPSVKGSWKAFLRVLVVFVELS